MASGSPELQQQLEQQAYAVLDAAGQRYRETMTMLADQTTANMPLAERYALQESAQRAWKAAQQAYEFQRGLGLGSSEPTQSEQTQISAAREQAGIDTKPTLSITAGTPYYESSSPTGSIIVTSRPIGEPSTPTTPTVQRISEELPMAREFNLAQVALTAARQPKTTPEEIQRVITLESAGFNKTVLMPYGERTQIAVERSKYAIDPISGEIGVYQVPIDPYTGRPRTGVYGAEAGGILIGGGGRYAAQSGMFSEYRGGILPTPDIREQYNPEKYSAKYANRELADLVRANPEQYSRLGAEAYGGMVLPLDSRKLTPEARMSVYPREYGNLANLAFPWGANVGKGDYSGADIPWSVSMGAPSRQFMGPQGFIMEAPSPFTVGLSREEIPGIELNTGRAFEAFPTEARERRIVDVGVGMTTGVGPDVVTRQPSVVRGGKTVASVAATEPAFDIANAPRPFVSGKVSGGEGAITIPLFSIAKDVQIGTPEPLKGIISFFQPRTFTPTAPSRVFEVDPKTMAGPDYTRMFISPETGSPTRTIEYETGKPEFKTVVDPYTGATITQETRQYETMTIPEKITMAEYKPAEFESGYEQFLDREFRSRMPKAETGERALAMSQLANPFAATEGAGVVAGREIAFRAAEAIGIKTTGARESQGFVTSIVSPTKGQYEFFLERPELSAVSFGTMGLTGAVARGGVGLLSKVPAGERAVARAAPFVEQVVAPTLGMVYGGMVSYEETGGFTDITPRTVARIKSRAYQEGIPGTVGIVSGYQAPEIAGFVGRSAARAPGVVSEKIFEMRQRAAGIERVERGTTEFTFDVMSESPVMPRQAPTRETLAWKPSKSEAMEYIKARYPEQGAIWDRYMTDVQKISTKDARSFLQERYPNIKITGEMLSGERGRIKLERTETGLFRQTESGSIIPAGTTLTVGAGRTISTRSLYYSSVIEPQFKGVREQTYGVPLKEQRTYIEASPAQQRKMREAERESMRRAEKAYRGIGGGSGGGGISGTVFSPTRKGRAGGDEFDFSVSSGVGGQQILQRPMTLTEELGMTGRQTKMRVLEEEESYFASAESIRRAGPISTRMSQTLPSISSRTQLIGRDTFRTPSQRESVRQSVAEAQRQKYGSLSEQMREQRTVSQQSAMQRTIQAPSLLRESIRTPFTGTPTALRIGMRQEITPALTRTQRSEITQIKTPTQIPRITQITRPITDMGFRFRIPELPRPPGVPLGFPTSGGGSGAGAGGRRLAAMREVIPLRSLLSFVGYQPAPITHGRVVLKKRKK